MEIGPKNWDFEKTNLKVASNHTWPWYYFLRTKQVSDINDIALLHVNVCTMFINKKNVMYRKLSDLRQLQNKKPVLLICVNFACNLLRFSQTCEF